MLEFIKKWWLIAVLVVAACCMYVFVADSNRKHDEKMRAQAERVDDENKALLSSKTANVRVLDSEHGQLLIVRAPIKGEFFGVEMQTCFVWRDAVTKASSLDCSKDAEMLRHRD